MDERGYEVLPENLNLARAFVAMTEHTTAVETEKRNLEEQVDALRETLRWFASQRGFVTDEQDARVREALGG